MRKYKVFFYRGDELTLKTRVMKGHAWVDEQGVHITSDVGSFVVPSTDIRSVELFRLHGLGRVIRIDHAQGRLFVAVVRLMMGQFAIINFIKTGRLREDIAGLVHQPSLQA
jgi:hypothetical protein